MSCCHNPDLKIQTRDPSNKNGTVRVRVRCKNCKTMTAWAINLAQAQRWWREDCQQQSEDI